MFVNNIKTRMGSEISVVSGVNVLSNYAVSIIEQLSNILGVADKG